jgi:hypothetical protein
MAEELIQFLSNKPYYSDVESPRFEEGLMRALTKLPRRQVTDFIFRRPRVGRDSFKSDTLSGYVMSHPYYSQHKELLKKTRIFMNDRYVGEKKLYRSYSLPNRRVMKDLFQVIWDSYRMIFAEPVVVPAVAIVAPPLQIENKEMIFEVKKTETVKQNVEQKEYTPSGHEVFKVTRRFLTDREYAAEQKMLKKQAKVKNWPDDFKPDFNESYMQLVFNYVMKEQDSPGSVPLRLFYPLKEFIDRYMLSYIMRLYPIPEILHLGICTQMDLIMAGIEPNPGPICPVCFFIRDDDIEWCPNCEYMPYIDSNSGLSDNVREKARLLLERRGLRCVLCQEPLSMLLVPSEHKGISRQALIFGLVAATRCKQCQSIYTYLPTFMFSTTDYPPLFRTIMEGVSSTSHPLRSAKLIYDRSCFKRRIELDPYLSPLAKRQIHRICPYIFPTLVAHIPIPEGVVLSFPMVMLQFGAVVGFSIVIPGVTSGEWIRTTITDMYKNILAHVQSLIPKPLDIERIFCRIMIDETSQALIDNQIIFPEDRIDDTDKTTVKKE